MNLERTGQYHYPRGVLMDVHNLEYSRLTVLMYGKDFQPAFIFPFPFLYMYLSVTSSNI